MTPTESANLAVVYRYFEGCSLGDERILRETLSTDVVHYFLPPRFPPIRGADHLVRHWCKFHRLLAPTWAVDHAIARDDEVVSEWSCAWTPVDSGRRVMMRGSEWYVLTHGRICEIRAYLMDDPTADTGLQGFPYTDRGFLTKD